MAATEGVEIDCDAGRRLGCATFCCRLLVRLREEERSPTADGSTAKGFVDKDPDGLCVNLDRTGHRCRIWYSRPHICRAYDCNTDYLLQVAIRVGVKNIAQLALDAARLHIPQHEFVSIPACSCGQTARRERAIDD